MDDTTTVGVADAGQLESRLATLQGHRDAAREELAEAGGIDPELKLELRKLDEAIRNLNVQLFLARGKSITRPKKRMSKPVSVERERCQHCKRLFPANHHVEDVFLQEAEMDNGETSTSSEQQAADHGQAAAGGVEQSADFGEGADASAG